MIRLNPYRIGFRTIKTAVGMALGVIIAKLLGLDNYASSAILVVLCIKDTKMHSVHAIISRFVSCIIAIGFGALIFPLLGQHALLHIYTTYRCYKYARGRCHKYRHLITFF